MRFFPYASMELKIPGIGIWKGNLFSQCRIIQKHRGQKSGSLSNPRVLAGIVSCFIADSPAALIQRDRVAANAQGASQGAYQMPLESSSSPPMAYPAPAPMMAPQGPKSSPKVPPTSAPQARRCSLALFESGALLCPDCRRALCDGMSCFERLQEIQAGLRFRR